MTIDWNAIAREQHLTVRSAVFLGEGWDFRAWLVNEELVFRFPKRAAEWSELERERGFLAWAAERLPLRVPRIANVVHASRAAPHGYVVHCYLPGEELSLHGLCATRRSALADDLAHFMRALHALQPPPEVSKMLWPDETRTAGSVLRTRAPREIGPQLTSAQTRRLESLLAEYVDHAPNFAYDAVVLHADLSPDHLLVRDGALHGVIDWTDVAWGDPDREFGYLFTDVGARFTEEVARRYGHPDLERLRRKLAFFELSDALETILDGSGVALEGELPGSWAVLHRILS